MRNFEIYLSQLGLDEAQISARVSAALNDTQPLMPIVPEVERLLGPAGSVEEVLASLDRSYREQNKPEVWFLPLNVPIAPHLDTLLGPAGSFQDVLDTLDQSYRDQNKPPIWFLPLDKPISPHLDELLGKVRE